MMQWPQWIYNKIMILNLKCIYAKYIENIIYDYSF